MRARPGTVYLVGAGPGDPELLTQRGLDLLASAEVILHDELVHPVLLQHVRRDARVEYVGKRGDSPSTKQLAQESIDRRLVELAREGRAVVRLKGGDPFLFGRGSEEAEALAREGIPFEIVPGVTSPLAAAAYAGISLTHRDLASSVLFVSGTTRHGTAYDFRELRGHTGTVCILMPLRRLEGICDDLVRLAGRDPGTPVAVVQSGTRAEQRVVEGTLADVAARVREARLVTPALVIVGQVVRLRARLRWFDRLPLFGKRVLVTRAEHQAEATSALLRRRGAEPVELPLLVIGEPPDPLRVDRAVAELSSYDLAVFTSENGVERFFARVAAAGRDARAFGAARVAAIGDGTARALARFGVRADVVPTSFRGEALAEAVLADLARVRGTARGAKVIVPRALVAREVLPETLRAAGVHVDVVPVYETRAAGSERRTELRAMLEARGIDVVLLASSSTADSLCDLIGPDAAELLGPTTVASIGAITTSTAEGRGLRVDVTASTSTIEGLVEALEGRLAEMGLAPAPGAS